jgi:hypothetical protein
VLMHTSGNMPPITVLWVDEATLVWAPRSKKWISAMDKVRRIVIHRWQLTTCNHHRNRQGHLVAKRNHARRATNGVWQSYWKKQHGDSYFDINHWEQKHACLEYGNCSPLLQAQGTQHNGPI